MFYRVIRIFSADSYSVGQKNLYACNKSEKGMASFALTRTTNDIFFALFNNDKYEEETRVWSL